MNITASLKILDNISVIISTKKYDTDTPLLVFHLVQAFRTAKGFVNFITKQNNYVFFNSMKRKLQPKHFLGDTR